MKCSVTYSFSLVIFIFFGCNERKNEIEGVQLTNKEDELVYKLDTSLSIEYFQIDSNEFQRIEKSYEPIQKDIIPRKRGEEIKYFSKYEINNSTYLILCYSRSSKMLIEKNSVTHEIDLHPFGVENPGRERGVLLYKDKDHIVAVYINYAINGYFLYHIK